MTDDAKRGRRDQIQELAEARAERLKQGFATYWLTRDTRDGQLTDYVNIWLRRPSRTRLDDGDVFWMASHPDGSGAHYGRWTLAQARFEVGGGMPEDDRQCLRVGPEPVIAPEALCS